MYFSPSDVAIAMQGGPAARNLPDPIYSAARSFARRHGYLRSVGQYARITLAGRRYLHRYGVA